LLNLWFNPSPEGFPWDDLRKIFIERSQMAEVPNGVETLPKISIAWVGCTNVTDRRQTTDRQTDGRRHIANVNVSSRSLKTTQTFSKTCKTNSRHYEYTTLENVAIANALQLEAARATPVLSHFNYDAMPNLTSLNLSIVVLWRFCCMS